MSCTLPEFFFVVMYISNWSSGSILIYVSNEPKSELARDLGGCHDNDLCSSKLYVVENKKSST